MIVTAVALFLTGLLAGEEFIVRFGVHPALARMDDRGSIAARQGLIRTLRIIVPIIALSSLAVTIVAAVIAVTAFSVLAAAALLTWLVTTVVGTVPINSVVVEWDAAAPPSDWRTIIVRWQRIDIVRSSAALLAFALLVVATTMR